VNVPSGHVKVVAAHANVIRDHFFSLAEPIHVPQVSSKVHQRPKNRRLGHFLAVVDRVDVPSGHVKVLPAHVNAFQTTYLPHQKRVTKEREPTL
jgi:hypothetical protein